MEACRMIPYAVCLYDLSLGVLFKHHYQYPPWLWCCMTWACLEFGTLAGQCFLAAAEKCTVGYECNKLQMDQIAA